MNTSDTASNFACICALLALLTLAIWEDLADAIPPAYTEFVGGHVFAAVEGRVAA